MTLLELTLETAINEAGEFKDVRLSKEDAEYILSILKEQEAVPVVQREVMNLLVWCCGSCGVAITDGDKYCRMCGRRMKWK